MMTSTEEGGIQVARRLSRPRNPRVLRVLPLLELGRVDVASVGYLLLLLCLCWAVAELQHDGLMDSRIPFLLLCVPRSSTVRSTDSVGGRSFKYVVPNRNSIYNGFTNRRYFHSCQRISADGCDISPI